MICRYCGLVYQNPRPSTSEVTSLYAGEVYRREITDAEANERMEYFLRRPVNAIRWLYQQPEFLDRFEVGHGRKLLDIGSGWGGALLRFKERGWEPFGVEPDPRCAEYANARFGGATKTEFLTERTWPDLRFSLVFSQHAFEHMLDPLGIARVARQILDQEVGMLFICVPTYRKTWTFAWSYFNTAHTYMFTHKTLGNLLARAGFHVLHHRYFSSWDREGEVWVLAQVDRDRPSGVDAHSLPFRESRWRSQVELVLVPLTAALGLVGRLLLGGLLLVARPRAFFATSTRLRLLFTDPHLFVRKVDRKLRTRAKALRMQFTRDRRVEH